MVCSGLQKPLMPIFEKGMIFIADEEGVHYVDLEGSTIIDLDQMTASQMKKALIDRKILPKGRQLKKEEMKKILGEWIVHLSIG